MTHRGIGVYGLRMLVIISVAGSVAAAERKSPKGWTGSGELGSIPTRITDALPLSDQVNQGKWQIPVDMLSPKHLGGLAFAYENISSEGLELGI